MNNLVTIYFPNKWHWIKRRDWFYDSGYIDLASENNFMWGWSFNYNVSVYPVGAYWD